MEQYVPPPKPLSPEQRDFRLRLSGAFGILFVLGALGYFVTTGETLWRAALLVAPLALIFSVVLLALRRSVDTVSMVMGYMGTGIWIMALILGYAAGK